MYLIGNIANIICSLFGIGFVKKGSPNVGAILGALFYYILNEERIFLLILIWCTILLTGIVFADIISKDHNGKDPQFIIINEFIGAFTALMFLPKYNILIYFLAIIFFRTCDKLKPLGIKRVEFLKAVRVLF